MKQLPSALLCVATLVMPACRPADDVLATCNGQPITVADLDAFVLTLPEKARQVDEGESTEEWAEASLRRLGVERALMDTATARELAESTEIESLRTSGKVRLLVDQLMFQLAASYQPGPETLATITEDLAQRSDARTLYTFEHIFFRLDRAATPDERHEVRVRAEAVAAQARAGHDFAELARLHSESTTAEKGGLLVNVARTDLNEETVEILNALEEGEVSPVVETRTGLHVFRLKRRLEVAGPDAEHLEQLAQKIAARRWLAAERDRLLERLRAEVSVNIEDTTWQVGSWVLDRETIDDLSATIGSGERIQAALVDELLLAEEALVRGLWTPEMERANEHTIRVAILERSFRQERRAYLESLSEQELRPLYDSQPSAFAAPEKADVDIIFVPQGRDAFETQRRLEDYVAALRAGASFADLAREISEGPAAEQGGAVGLVERQQWGVWGQPVFDAIRSLEPGQISDPIFCTDRMLTKLPTALRGGFAIVRVNKRIPEQPRSFDEAIDQIRISYAAKHRREVDEAVRQRLLDRVGFTIHRVPSAAEFQR